MAKSLHFRYDVAARDYVERMMECIDRLADEYLNEVTAGMKTDAGKGDVRVEKLTDDDKLYLARQVIGGPFAVMDSFGTGSLADVSNPAWNDYIDSVMYNPERAKVPGAPITGRPEGEYTNIFGEQAYSSGRLAGVNLEKFPGSPIRPQSPSGAFQDAESWFKASDRVRELIKEYDTAFWLQVGKNGARYWRFS